MTVSSHSSPNIVSCQNLVGSQPLDLLSTAIDVKFHSYRKLEEALIHWTHNALSSFPDSVSRFLQSYVSRFQTSLRNYNCTRYRQQCIFCFLGDTSKFYQLITTHYRTQSAAIKLCGWSADWQFYCLSRLRSLERQNESSICRFVKKRKNYRTFIHAVYRTTELLRSSVTNCSVNTFLYSAILVNIFLYHYDKRSLQWEKTYFSLTCSFKKKHFFYLKYFSLNCQTKQIQKKPVLFDTKRK